MQLNVTMEHLITGASKLGLNLTPGQIKSFQTYYEELTDWSHRINLTAITDYKEVQVKHFLDSLTVSLALPDSTNLKLMDVGSGGGFPGVPLKIIYPQLHLTLLEATGKKTEFLKHLVQKLGLNDIHVIASRAEEAAHEPCYREYFDIVVARGLAEMNVLVELTLPFCNQGGRLIAQKKGDISDELKGAENATRLMGGRLDGVKNIELLELADERCLVVIEKVVATPPQYPRRIGIPAKRPLV